MSGCLNWILKDGGCQAHGVVWAQQVQRWGGGGLGLQGGQGGGNVVNKARELGWGMIRCLDFILITLGSY